MKMDVVAEEALNHKNVAAELLEKLLKDELRLALEAQPRADCAD